MGLNATFVFTVKETNVSHTNFSDRVNGNSC